MTAIWGLIGCGQDTVDCSSATFSSAEWKATSRPLADGATRDRSDLAAVLVRCDAPLGKDQTAVRALLGDPDNEDEHGWTYYVAKPDSSLESRPLQLFVQFGPDKRVSDVLGPQ